jgi:GTP pyrophosphokinase
MNDLERAISLALDAHEDDTDKAGKTYIRHPLRLMEQMDTKQERIVAVLHDVVEDSEYELNEIETEFGTEVSDAVDVLTKPEGVNVDYLEEYIPSIAGNRIAQKVKRADLRDNLDVTRLSKVNDSTLDNIKKYHQALQYLENKSEE